MKLYAGYGAEEPVSFTAGDPGDADVADEAHRSDLTPNPVRAQPCCLALVADTGLLGKPLA
jgi:hypothetical protein